VKQPLRFRKEVPDDIADACRWYQGCNPRLGRRFLGELRSALARIAASPESYAAGERGVRSARIHKFPYVVHFRFTGEEVVVLAIMFGGRDPSVWRSRL
jgi:plasmid stabilization system protein ParE